VVLYGGRSAEHEVSCVSAANVVSVLDPARYDVRLIGITTTGRWVDATRQLGAPVGSAGNGALPSPDSLVSSEAARSLSPGGRRVSGLPGLDGLMVRGTDGDPGLETVVLPLLHGPMGEDGTVQGLLELAGLPYCGSGVAGAAVAMDKGLAKSLLAAAGLPQARWIYRREGHFEGDLPAEIEGRLGWPVFVKPANMGSSIGITKVPGPLGLPAALAQASRYDTAVVIEEAVAGARELEVGVLGWPELHTSVPGEIKPSRDFYDFEDKYVRGAAGLEVPAPVPAEVVSEISRLAVAACESLRVDSMARVDFFLTPDGRLLINEVNTTPGFTSISMFPRVWAASGVSYGELIDRLVDQARVRAERRRRFETSH
jgi:D-alanine-D-alanine ligase